MAIRVYRDRSGFKSIEPGVIRRYLDYDPATGVFTWLPRPDNKAFTASWAGRVAGHRYVCTIGKPYVRIRLLVGYFHAHRLAWIVSHGPIPDGMQVDHINGDGADNRLCNLRLVTVSQNKRNMRRPATNTSGRVGVHKHGRLGFYYAKGWANGKSIHLGVFKTFEEAADARQAWEERRGYHSNHGSDRAL